MKKTLLFVVIVMIASMLLTAAAATPKSQVWLHIINKTDQLVAMQLKGYGSKHELINNYYLTVKKDYDDLFWIERNVYNRTTWACGYKSSGKLYLIHNTRLNFTPCWGIPTNQGEPSQEKVRYFYFYTYVNGYHTKVSFYSPAKYHNDYGLWWHYRY